MSAVLIPTASKAEWLAARRKGITASEIAVVMGLSPYSSPYALYHRKLGNLPEQDETDAMALGKHMESFVAAKFAERHEEFAILGSGRELFAHPDRDWQLATPDRIVCERPSWEPAKTAYGPAIAVLECKIDGGSDEWGEDGTGQIPVHYRCQLLWQMRVMGVHTGYLACLLWNRRQVRVYELTLGDEALADLLLMEGEACEFLDRLTFGREPDVDWRPATTAALKHLHPSLKDEHAPIGKALTRQYRAAIRRYQQAEQRKDLLTNRIRAAIGPSRYAVSGGEVIARRDVYPVKEHVRKATTVDRLVAVKPKGDQK